ncbi:MAG: glycosyltransferase [Pseudomonadota bacterium]
MAEKPFDQAKLPRRIAVVGPVPPIRSGVARHTAAVAFALAQNDHVELRTWSFRRQYPNWLYPGESEVAEDAQAPEGLNVTWSLDGINPQSWHKTARDIRAWRPNLVILPAWTFFLAPALGWVARDLRRAGVECCVIVHNAFDHEDHNGTGWKARLSLWQLAQADRYVTHNEAIAKTLENHKPGIPVRVFPHPTFDDFPDPVGSLPREAGLELLFFGLVRPYKGLDLAIEALARSGRRDLRLTIAGEFWQGLEETRQDISRLGIGDQVELIPRHVSDAETAELFDRADVVLLPYRSVTASGVIPVAYRYGRAVIASDLPGFSSVVKQGETGWLVPSEDIDALSAILRGLDRSKTEAAGEKALKLSAELSWERFAELVLGSDLVASSGAKAGPA